MGFIARKLTPRSVTRATRPLHPIRSTRRDANRAWDRQRKASTGTGPTPWLGLILVTALAMGAFAVFGAVALWIVLFLGVVVLALANS